LLSSRKVVDRLPTTAKTTNGMETGELNKYFHFIIMSLVNVLCTVGRMDMIIHLGGRGGRNALQKQ
jgi:hypothetical protein